MTTSYYQQHLEELHYRLLGHAVVQSYLIDATGHGTKAHVEADYRERAEPLRVLEALQLVSKPVHG